MSAQQHLETFCNIGKTGMLVSKLAKQIYASIILKRTKDTFYALDGSAPEVAHKTLVAA
jgi:hypothetical protein